MPLTFTQLEERYGNFYVPAFRLLVDGKDVVSKLFLEIPTVQVDNTLKGADRFSFTVNSTFSFQNREFAHLDDVFRFGNSVDIFFGYGSSLTLMHRGLITEVKTSFPASGLPQITVSGYDPSYHMTKGKKSRNWDDRKDSDVVATVAEKYGFTPVIDDTGVKLAKVEQSQESDLAFVEKLAKRNGFEFYIFDDKLYFRQPANDEDGTVSLEWGKGLVSFSPEANLADQVSKVEVRGWNVAQKKEFVGTAQPGEEPGRDPNRSSGAEVVKTVCKNGADLKIRIPVYSQDEADKHAKGILKQKAEKFIQGSGESIGLPEIRADKNIQLLGLGRKFSKTYYVEQSTHVISTSGYRTTFKVKDTTI